MMTQVTVAEVAKAMSNTPHSGGIEWAGIGFAAVIFVLMIAVMGMKSTIRRWFRPRACDDLADPQRADCLVSHALCALIHYHRGVIEPVRIERTENDLVFLFRLTLDSLKHLFACAPLRYSFDEPDLLPPKMEDIYRELRNRGLSSKPDERTFDTTDANGKHFQIEFLPPGPDYLQVQLRTGCGQDEIGA